MTVIGGCCGKTPLNVAVERYLNRRQSFIESMLRAQSTIESTWRLRGAKIVFPQHRRYRGFCYLQRVEWLKINREISVRSACETKADHFCELREPLSLTPKRTLRGRQGKGKNAIVAS